MGLTDEPLFGSLSSILDNGTGGLYLSVAVVILLATCWHFWLRGMWNPQHDQEGSTISFTSCQSLDCVRCQKYEFYLSCAEDRLDKFNDNFGNEGTGRIAQAIKDRGTRSESQHEEQEPNVLYVPGLVPRAWWNGCTEYKTEIDAFENRKDDILLEYQHVAASVEEPDSGWCRNNTPTGQWSTFYLYNQGLKMTQNCARCPLTSALIENCPGFMRDSVFGNALFSVMHPQTDITEHYGPCNLRIRCHLGLVIPPDCHLEVHGECRTWTEGQCLLFDDSFKHSAHHRGQGSGTRVILLVDLWHPGVKDKERSALDYIFRADL